MPLKDYLSVFLWQFISFSRNLTKISHFKKYFYSKVPVQCSTYIKKHSPFRFCILNTNPGQPKCPHHRKWTASGNIICWKVRVAVFSLPFVLYFWGQFHRPCHCWTGKLENCRIDLQTCGSIFFYTSFIRASIIPVLCTIIIDSTWTPLIIAKLGKSYSLQVKAKPRMKQSDDTEQYYSCL